MYTDPVSHLPDPVQQSAFYSGVTIKRGLAWLIDLALILALTLAVSIISVIGVFFFFFMFFVVGFVYRWLTIAGGSATWGMRLMAIELRDAHGQRLDAGQALMHTLGYTISFAVPPLQLVSVLLMFLSERGQGLTDMVLGTTMLNRRA